MAPNRKEIDQAMKRILRELEWSLISLPKSPGTRIAQVVPAGFNRPLLPPRSEDVDILSRQQEQADIEKMKNFVQLRQDLERVRNLCYMVSRREKLSRSFFRMREQTFHKQVAVLSDPSCNLKGKEVAAVIQANHGPSIYDRLYSQPSAEEAASQFDLVLARIAGIASPPLVEDKPKVDLNGLVKRSDKSSDNPYKRMYFNGSGRRRSSLYGSMSSASETDSTRRQTSSSQDEGNVGNSASATKIVTKKRSKKSVVSRTRTDASTSEDDEKPTKSAWQGPRNRTLRQMEREMNSATDDSDELLPMKPTKSEPHKITAIYSDSDSEPSKGAVSEEDKVPSDSQQHVLRTKAAMKEFSAGLQPKVDRPSQKSNKMSRSAKSITDKSITREDSMDDDSTKDKENVKSTKKVEYDPSDLIVPQRQAAKKASESIRCSQGKSKEQILFEQEALKTSPVNEEQKVKQKTKHKSKELRDGKSGDIYDFEKEVIEVDTPEILAYVPQRQAAKKAAQHIKSGMTKPIPGAVEVESAEVGKGKRDLSDIIKSKKELDVIKSSKKEIDSEKLKRSKSPDSKGKMPSKSREILSTSSSTSSSGDSSKSSSSESESDDKAKPIKKEKVEKKELLSPHKESEKKPKRIAGKSNEDWPFLDKGDQSSRSSSSSRGSDSSDDSDMFTRKKESISPHKSNTKAKEGSPSKHVGKKFTKAPDKKLKTSDGRPEPEFQPPFLERDEPSRTKESMGRSRKAGASTSDRVGNTDGRSRNLLVSPSRSQGRDSSTSSGDRPSASRAPEQLPDSDGRKHRKEQSKSEGGKRKPSEVYSGDTSLRKETSKSGQLHSVKKTDKKVTLSDNKGGRKSEKKEDRDASAIRLEREIANRKADRTSLSKKSSKVSSLDRLFDKRESKIEKLVNKKNLDRDSISPVKVSPKNEPVSKHKHSLPKDSHKKLSPSREVSSKRAIRERDLFGVEDSNKKNKNSDRDVASKTTKHNAIIIANTPKSSPKHSREPTHRKSDSANVKKREDKTSSPKKDHRTSTFTEEKRLSLDLNEVPQKREKDVRRESTESLASVSTDIDDDKTKKKAKPMPRCKKQALGILSDSQDKTEIKIDEIIAEKSQTLNVILPNEQIFPPQDMVAIVEEIIPSPKQSIVPVILVDQESKPDTQRVTGTFRPIPQLEKPDPVEELPVPDPEPQKITSRTSSLYQQRSIFSPQQPKDPAVAELFDFENDILAVDETVNDDGFSMARDTEELMRPLTFSFSSEFLFKEESKEDSERETLNLVEKLRLEYAKKSTTGPGQGDASSVGVEDEEASVILEEKPPELPEVEIVEPPKPSELKEPSPCEASIGGPRSIESCAVESKVLPASTPIPSSQLEPQDIPLKAPPYAGYEYNSCNVPVSMPGREKLDRSNSDERWVPPSGMEFVQQRIHHYEPHPPDTPAPSPYTDLQARAKWADSEVLPVRRSSSSSASSSSSSSHREDLELQKRDELLYSSVAELYQGVHSGISSFPPCALDVHAYHPYSDASQFVGPVALFPPTCAQLPFPSPGAAMFPPPFGPPFSTAQLLQPVPKPPEEPHMPPPCGAAFTSSSHNMALTAAMVSPPPQVPTPSPVLHPEPITVNPESLHLNQQPLSIEPEPLSSDREPEPTLPIDSIVNHDVVKESPVPKPAANPPGKKSPTKPTRTSARVTSQLSKSPGKSPRQQEQIPAKSPARVRDSGGKRGKGSANRGGHGQNRGGSRRGRGRGRGNMHYQDIDYNTIHSKLAGTVYDLEFDDDSPSEGVESMRAMRERRRSSDHHERKMGMDYASQDLSQSPKFGTSPHQNSKLRYNMDARDLRPPTPMSGHRTPADEELMPPPSPLATSERIEHFPDVVRPLLPGPVDMRTYSSTGYEPSPANNPAAYHNHLLGQFATAAAEQHVTDFVEDLEKELHTALAASKSSEAFRPEEVKIADVTAANDDSVSQIKVSLSDSRNQLKVKIKGPFLDANYSASSATQQQVVMPIPPDVVAAAVPVAATNAFNVGASTGTSNLRRMRKKELLRQYCSQDMNMIDPAGGPMLGGVAPPTAAPPVSRTVITIPKAVASMTTIPTREDYKAVVDANMEKKRRKEKATLSSSLSGPRELRHLDLTLGLDESDLPERRRSVGSTGSNGSVQFDVSIHPVKRRGRPAKPVLKIKIGNSVITEETNEEKRLRVRPPKKRLSSVPMPSMEEMKRESMKYRKMIMADFEQEEKKRSKSVGGKRRKKHGDQRHEVRIVASESEQASGTKLIIRFNKCASGEPPEDPGGGRTSLPSGPQETLPPVKDKLLTVPVSVSEKKGPSPLLKVRTSKMTPIRLKLSRCHEGYVMKKPLLDPLAPVSEPNVSVNDSEQSLNNSSAGSSVPVNQGCEVR